MFKPESKIDINKLQIPINTPNVKIFNKINNLLTPIEEIMIKMTKHGKNRKKMQVY